MLWKKGKDMMLKEIENHKECNIWRNKWLSQNTVQNEDDYFTQNEKESLLEYRDPKWLEMEEILNDFAIVICSLIE